MTNPASARIFHLLFPACPRDFPFRRTVRILLRTAHVLTAGVLLGGHIFHQQPAVLEPWLWATVISGLLVLATDIHASLAVLFELRGIAVLLKIILLFLIPVFWEERILLLVIILMVGVISSHMPKRYRHKLVLFQNRIAPDQRNG